MHEQLSEPLNTMQVSEYLRRLGLAKEHGEHGEQSGLSPQEFAKEQSGPPSLELLNKLIHAQQTTIPFETLAINGDGQYLAQRQPIKLDTQSLFTKLITNKRGGFCFELNALFARLLEALGFELSYHLARAVIRRDYLDPNLHRINLVILDHQHYLADVGFGGPSPSSAIPLRIGEHQDSSGEYFALSSVQATQQFYEQPASYSIDPDSYLWLLERSTAGGRQKILLIDISPCFEVDFIAPSFYCANHPDSFFVQHRIVNIRREGGSANITDNHIRVLQDGQAIIDRDLSGEKDLSELLQTFFGL